jgi:hypothetical protein
VDDTARICVTEPTDICMSPLEDYAPAPNQFYCVAAWGGGSMFNDPDEPPEAWGVVASIVT